VPGGCKTALPLTAVSAVLLFGFPGFAKLMDARVPGFVELSTGRLTLRGMAVRPFHGFAWC
jgi:hypothetical protein